MSPMLNSKNFTRARPSWPSLRSTKPAPVPTLTPSDYLQIQQLVARYSYALDTGADNGYAYADLFAEGASFGNARSRDQLAATRNARQRMFI